MSKVDIGDLKNLIKNQPDIAATVAFAQRMVLITAANFGDFTSFVILGHDETTPEIIVSKAELLKFARSAVDQYDPKPVGKYWVTNHDAPEESKRVSGPYSTSADAGRAREILERFEHHHNYWIEELES